MREDIESNRIAALQGTKQLQDKEKQLQISQEENADLQHQLRRAEENLRAGKCEIESAQSRSEELGTRLRDLAREVRALEEDNDALRAEMKVQQANFVADMKHAEAASNASVEAAVEAEKVQVGGDQQSATDRSGSAASGRVKAALDAAIETTKQECRRELESLRRELEASSAASIAILKAEHAATVAKNDEEIHRKFRIVEARADAAQHQ